MEISGSGSIDRLIYQSQQRIRGENSKLNDKGAPLPLEMNYYQPSARFNLYTAKGKQAATEPLGQNIDHKA